MKKVLLYITLISMLLSSTLRAEIPQLSIPLKCRIGHECWITRHYDLDPTSHMKDYTGGDFTQDEHHGVDIALQDQKSMNDGKDVIAAASGIVIAVREGEPDINVQTRGLSSVKNKECGNGIVIAVNQQHVTSPDKSEWCIQYCHLKHSSIKVRVGQKVTTGQELAQVGQSGLSEYPHLHFLALNYGKPIDVFSGKSQDGTGPGKSLWLPEVVAQMPYQPGVIQNMGIAAHSLPMDKMMEAVRNGQFRSTDLSSQDAVIGWCDLFGADVGDTLEIECLDPEGKSVFNQTQKFEKHQARFFFLYGKKAPAQGWEKGNWTLHIRYESSKLGTSHGRSLSFTVR